MARSKHRRRAELNHRATMVEWLDREYEAGSEERRDAVANILGLLTKYPKSNMNLLEAVAANSNVFREFLNMFRGTT